MKLVLAAAVMVGILAAPAAAAPSAPAAPSAAYAPAPSDKPPFPYADCIKATKKRGESQHYGKWHCDQLVKKGWVRPPKR
ncbi:hypothetical protein [Streptomyces sp. NPDC008001]|uniref:hypothetical protein n=1 Tax=Streptomyces sp. NPDC008001 TaxID=3364804 RepID=UPI0036EBE498